MNNNLFRYFVNLILSKIQNRPNLQLILQNIAWLSVDNFFRIGIGLFVSLWVARYLGVERYGIYNFAIAYSSLFSPIANLGLDGVVVREIIRNKNLENKILGTTFVIRFLSGVFSCLLASVTILFVYPHNSSIQKLVVIISIGITLQCFDTIGYWFQSQISSKFIIYARNAAFLIVSIIKIFLIIIKAPLIYFAYTFTIEVILFSVGLVIVYNKQGYSIKKWTFSLDEAIRLLKDSWPLIFSVAMVMIHTRIDQVMLGKISGPEELGIYSAAVKVAEIWLFVPMAIVPSIFPKLLEMKNNNEGLFYYNLERTYKLMAFIAYCIAILVTMFSKKIIWFLFGVQYMKAGTVLVFLSWACLFNYLGIVSGFFLTAKNWTKTHLMISAIGCILNIILNFLLIPKYGAKGAAISSLVSYWFSVHGLYFFFKHLYSAFEIITKALLFPVFWKKTFD